MATAAPASTTCSPGDVNDGLRSAFNVRLARLLNGPPPVLPAPLDRLCERWACCPPRLRLAVLLAAVLTVFTIAGRGAARSPWGPPAAVLVARADLPAGHVLESADLVAARWPARLVPAGSPSEAPNVTGTPLAIGLPEGSLLTSAHLARGGLAAELAADHVAVPVKVPEGVTLTSAQHVDLVALDADGRGVPLASDASVLAIEGVYVWVAVKRHEAPAVAATAAQGEVGVALLPGPSA
ncbi:MAG: SAF domain-containing protein [Actinomycetota bacterium]|nr:SAF domain-containing protein [Actinomycetota bacterium]